MRVFVLGHRGMLGHMVVKYLKSKGVDIAITNKRFPGWNPRMFARADYIINCIGAIPQRTNDFKINYELPEWLCTIDRKVIHPGTNCEANNEYSLSKVRAENYIIENGNKTKILKTSIIGPELNTKNSLLEWFLSQGGEVFGHTKAMWNGNTTLEWAKQCLHLIENWESYKILTILEGECISKYDMLNMIKEVFGKTIEILPKEFGKNELLNGDIITSSFRQQLKELKEFYYDN
jgi:dTDP-4-dehydrorhamnose reductase